MYGYAPFAPWKYASTSIYEDHYDDNDDDCEHNNSVTVPLKGKALVRSEEHTSELQSQFRISYAVFCLKKKKRKKKKKKKKVKYS